MYIQGFIFLHPPYILIACADVQLWFLNSQNVKQNAPLKVCYGTMKPAIAVPCIYRIHARKRKQTGQMHEKRKRPDTTPKKQQQKQGLIFSPDPLSAHMFQLERIGATQWNIKELKKSKV